MKKKINFFFAVELLIAVKCVWIWSCQKMISAITVTKAEKGTYVT